MTDDDHVTIRGEDRFVAGESEPDFAITIARRQLRPESGDQNPPHAAASAGADSKATPAKAKGGETK